MKLEVPIKVGIDDVTELIHELQCLQTYKLGVNETTVLVSLDAVVDVFKDHIRAKRLDKDIDVPTKWIPVSERLPESADCPMDCLVTRKSKNIGNYTDMAVAESDGTWTHEDWEAIVLGDNVCGKKTGLLNTCGDKIVAWMPLPEPYKEGEQHETD